MAQLFEVCSVLSTGNRDFFNLRILCLCTRPASSYLGRKDEAGYAVTGRTEKTW